MKAGEILTSNINTGITSGLEVERRRDGTETQTSESVREEYTENAENIKWKKR